MLRRVENVQVFYRRDFWGLLSGRYNISLEVGKKRYIRPGRIKVDEFRAMEARSMATPVRYMSVGDRVFWRYAGKWHSENEGLAEDAVHALLVTRAMRNEDRVSRARTIAAQGSLPVPSQRTSIAPDVKQLVWNRDGGSCRSCGSTSELQFDHVIPVAHGGGSTDANLQVLCGPCNRRKGASIA